MVAGYVDGRYKWSRLDWLRWRRAARVRIACFASTDDGDVLDVERGNATAEQVPDWLNLRRASVKNRLARPATVYCGTSDMLKVVDACHKAGVALPLFWWASWNGKATVPAGYVAHQYQSTARWDISVTVGGWPGC